MPATSLPHAGMFSATAVDPDGTSDSRPAVRPFSVYGFEFSLGTASLDALEVVARSVTRAEVEGWFARFTGTEEVALLSTCHRVELVVLVRSPEELDRWREVLPGERGSWNLREGRELVRHLFRVAAGRESLAIGEAEVRQQVRSAVGGIQSRHPRAVLGELFAAAAATADELSPSVPSTCSIASIASSRLLELLGRTFPRVLVVGSGTVGRQVAESLSNAAEVTVVFHQQAPEDAFLSATGIRAIHLDRMAPELAKADAVVTAAKFGGHGLRATDLPVDHSLVLVDLGVPRNIDPRVRELPNVRLVDLEELHTRSRRPGSIEEQDLRVEERASHFCDRLESLLLEPWIDAFRRVAEELRRSELAEARPYLGELDPAQEAAIERLTQRIVTRLLLGPTERIRALPPGPEGDLQRRIAVDLLRPRLAEP